MFLLMQNFKMKFFCLSVKANTSGFLLYSNSAGKMIFSKTFKRNNLSKSMAAAHIILHYSDSNETTLSFRTSVCFWTNPLRVIHKTQISGFVFMILSDQIIIFVQNGML